MVEERYASAAGKPWIQALCPLCTWLESGHVSFAHRVSWWTGDGWLMNLLPAADGCDFVLNIPICIWKYERKFTSASAFRYHLCFCLDSTAQTEVCSHPASRFLRCFLKALKLSTEDWTKVTWLIKRWSSIQKSGPWSSSYFFLPLFNPHIINKHQLEAQQLCLRQMTQWWVKQTWSLCSKEHIN